MAEATPGRPSVAQQFPSRDAALADAYANAYDAARATGADAVDDGVLADGVLRTSHLLEGRGATIRRAQQRDVDLIVEQGGRRTFVAICNARHMTSLAARLKRLQDVPRQAGDRLVIVRDARLPISPRAQRTREHLERVRAKGGAVLRSTPEAYAALAAIRSLLAASAAGDLVVDGETVAQETIEAWLSSNLPAPAVDLLEDLEEESPRHDDEGMDRLNDALAQCRITTLERVAALVELPPDAVWELATRHPDRVGTLSGPPRVLFLVGE
jgi:hypothetical protein